MRVNRFELERDVHYYIFKFKASKPRWAKTLNWMIGIYGPYAENSGPFDIPRRIFSRFKEIGEINLQDEVNCAHVNITEKTI